jgi:hypothetical protein
LVYIWKRVLPDFEKPEIESMRLRQSVLVATTALVLVASGYAKHEKLPIPQQIMTAKTVYIDNRSGYADLGDRAYDEIKKWGRYQVVDSPEKADLVFLFSAKEYIGGYATNSYHNTTGTVNYAGTTNSQTYGSNTYGTTNGSGSVNAQTYGSSTSRAIVEGTTYVTVLDPKNGTALWSDAHAWGRFKSATRGLVKELRDRVKNQEDGKN